MLLTALGLRKPENNDGFGQDDFNLNADAIDALLHAAGLSASAGNQVPAARVFHSVDQSIANATGTILAFDSERFDRDVMHDVAVNNSRLVFKTAGLYLFGAQTFWAANATGERQTNLLLNGGNYLVRDIKPAAAASTRLGMVATVWSFAIDDFVEVQVYQTSGGALSCIADTASKAPELWAVRVG